MTDAYAKAGVNIQAGYELVGRIKKHAQKTKRLGVLGSLGGFGGCFDLSELKVKEPILVSGTDGVGTKLLLAQQLDQHETIGIDCVAMCVNDIVAQGAQPLYFLDYIATDKIDPRRLETVVQGLTAGCVTAGAALIGGETAEMPGMYQPDEYDIAGFAVGVVEKKYLITGAAIQAGDVLIGLPSSGLHANGFSLVRKIFFEENNFAYDVRLPELGNHPLGELLLTPTRIYVPALAPLLEEHLIKGLAHITGGGFIENIPRMLPDTLAAEIHLNSWPILPIFHAVMNYGQLCEKESYGIFNMGIGMVLSVAADKIQRVQTQLRAQGESFYVIGKVIKRQGQPITFVGTNQ